MKCEEVKHYIELFIDSELDPKTNLEVSEHLSFCKQCNKRFSLEQDIEKKIVSVLSTNDESIEEVKELNRIWTRTLAKIDIQEKPSFRQRLRKRYLVPAFASFVAILFLIIYNFAESNDLVIAVSHCHSEYLDNKIAPTLETNVPQDITDYFSSKFDFPVRLPAENKKIQNSQLIGARLCYLKGTAVAYVMYKHHDSPLSLFYIDKKKIKNFPETKKILERKGFFERTNVNGHNIIAMDSGNIVICGISMLDLQLLKEVVHGCDP